MTEFDDYETNETEFDSDDIVDFDVAETDSSERFVRISEDVVVDVLTGNQYMPRR